MDTTYTRPLVVARRAGSKSAFWGGTKVALRALARALSEGVRGGELDGLFTTSSSAQFAALPRTQQNRQLDRGFRP